jgi:hypothetical protein
MRNPVERIEYLGRSLKLIDQLLKNLKTLKGLGSGEDRTLKTQIHESKKKLVLVKASLETARKGLQQKHDEQKAETIRERKLGPYRSPTERQLVAILMADYSIYSPWNHERRDGIRNLIRLGFLRRNDKVGMKNAYEALVWLEEVVADYR